jgi:beta-xylosidase
VSLAEAVLRPPPNAEVAVVAGTGVVPSEPTDITAAIAAVREADAVILVGGGHTAYFGADVTEGEGRDTANIDRPAQCEWRKKVAEGEGFEPPRASRPGGFQVHCLAS